MLPALLVSGYLLICVLLYTGQRQLLYFPQSLPQEAESHVTLLQGGAGALGVSTRAFDTPHAIIYFGGNADDVSTELAPFSRAFPDHALYLMHYRGYGASSGSPTEVQIHADAELLFEHVNRQHSRVTVIGRSLGSGVATRLARHRAVERLVLLTPYDSIAAVASRRFPFVPVAWLLKDRYDSLQHAPHITGPVLVLKSESDQVIPHAHTDRLIEQFDQEQLQVETIANTSHNTILDAPGSYRLIQQFLAAP